MRDVGGRPEATPPPKPALIDPQSGYLTDSPQGSMPGGGGSSLQWSKKIMNQ